MKIIRRLILSFALLSSIAYAEEKSLHVGVTHFLPPYVMQGANNTNYGFDIAMMEKICMILKRHCVYHTMPFEQLIPAVADKKIDVAVSFLTITPERFQKVNFSIPYLLSHTQVLTKHANKDTIAPLDYAWLQGKKIGVVSGTVFLDQLKAMNIHDPKIKSYPSNNNLIAALNSDEVEFVLVNQQTAHYWEANSSGAFHPAGSPFNYEYSVGIAVNKDDPLLLEQINKALLEYSNSNDFKMNYDKFISHF